MIAGQTVVNSINTTANQAREVAKATIEQSKTTQGIVVSTRQMQQIAKQVTQAMNEQSQGCQGGD